jgi:hypothetical protein
VIRLPVLRGERLIGYADIDPNAVEVLDEAGQVISVRRNGQPVAIILNPPLALEPPDPDDALLASALRKILACSGESVRVAETDNHLPWVTIEGSWWVGEDNWTVAGVETSLTLDELRAIRRAATK